MARNDSLNLHGDHSDHGSRDADLATRIHKGDEAALRQLIDRHQVFLARYINHILQSQDATEDVLQETFIHLWNTRSRIDPSRPLRNYLYRIARNIAFNTIASATARQRRESAASHVESPVDTQTIALEQDEFEMAVRCAVQALPSRCREVFILIREHEMTYAEVASVLGVSVSTVKTQMGRAMATLAARLAPFLMVTITARASCL